MTTEPTGAVGAAGSSLLDLEPAEAPARPLPAPGSVKAWVLAVRPKTLVAGWAPVLVGTSLALVSQNLIIPLRGGMALAVALLIQIGTNFVNDAQDHKKGADTADRLGPPRVVSSGLLPYTTVMRAGLLSLALAGAVGIALVSTTGSWWLLLPGGLAVACGVLYTAGPKPLAYFGLGEVFVFAFFGVFATTGSFYVQDPAGWQDFRGIAFWVGASMGALAVAILEVNNIRDIPTDGPAGKRTLAVRLGETGARVLYTVCLMVAFLCLIPVFFGQAVVAREYVFSIISVLFAVILGRGVWVSGRALNRVLARTAMFEGVFAILLALTFWLVAYEVPPR